MLPPPGLPPTSTPLEHVNPNPTSLISTALTSSSSSTTTSALLSLAMSSTSSVSPPTSSSSAPQNGECQLLGPFAILVQGSLGCAAILALVYKRWRERPQRPLKIWFFDVSKQVVGSVLVHIANLLMSMLSSGQFSVTLDAKKVQEVAAQAVQQRRMVDEEGKYVPNPCSFYLLNLAIDTTIGIPILIFLLRLLTGLIALTPLGIPRESIESGHYGTPARATWWFKQSIIYFIGLMGMKFCVLIIFLVLPIISRVGDWALSWTEGDEALQVVFVMLVFPVIMNATQYYIIDSFIKNQKPGEMEVLPDSDQSNDSDEHHDADSEEFGSEIEETTADAEVLAKSEIKKKKKPTIDTSTHSSPSSYNRKGSPLKTAGGNKDYDPLFDGEDSPRPDAGDGSGSASASSVSERSRLMQREEGDEEEPR